MQIEQSKLDEMSVSVALCAVEHGVGGCPGGSTAPQGDLVSRDCSV